MLAKPRPRHGRLACGLILVACAFAVAAHPVTVAQTRAGLDIHYVPTPPEVVTAMLDLAGVTDKDVLYDLGSGDGRIVIAAALQCGARGVGVELDPALVRTATAAALEAGVAGLVQFRTEDIFKADLSAATVVALYLSPTTNLRLRRKLQRELEPGSRVVSHRFDMGDWKPEQTRVIGGRQVLLWTIGPRVSR